MNVGTYDKHTVAGWYGAGVVSEFVVRDGLSWAAMLKGAWSILAALLVLTVVEVIHRRLTHRTAPSHD